MPMKIVKFVFGEEIEKDRITDKITVVMSVRPIMFPPLKIVHDPFSVRFSNVWSALDTACAALCPESSAPLFSASANQTVSPTKITLSLKGSLDRTPHTDDRTALVGYLHLSKPLAEGTSGSKIVQTFLSLDVEPVLIVTVNTGKHTKVDDTQSSLIIAVSHADHFRTVKFDTRDVITYRTGSGEKSTITVQAEFSGKK